MTNDDESDLYSHVPDYYECYNYGRVGDKSLGTVILTHLHHNHDKTKPKNKHTALHQNQYLFIVFKLSLGI